MVDTPTGRTKRSPRALEVDAGGRAFPVDVARHRRARRYVLRVRTDGRLRLTVPRDASVVDGLRFVERQREWIDGEWRRLEARSADWTTGTELWCRGVRVRLQVLPGEVALGDTTIPLRPRGRGVRAAVERHLRELATRELTDRATGLAVDRGIAIGRVSVRNQRCRWGSCSPQGAITLNWRLIQMPAEVADYVILHELAHRRHADHSPRFWQEVGAICPWWRDAERWLRRHGNDLL